MSSDPMAEAVDALYDAFASYPRPRVIRGCGCEVCFAEGRRVPGEYFNGAMRPLAEIDAPGAHELLRKLTAEDLSEFISVVPLTGGTLDDMKHYLPRLFELTVLGVDGGWQLYWPDIEILLPYVSTPSVPGDPWWSWPETEQAALGQFFDALWMRARRSDVATADDTLCALGLTVPSIKPFLDAWMWDADPAAVAVRHAYPEYGLDDAGELFNAFWRENTDHASTNRALLRAWIPASRGPQHGPRART